MFFFVTGLKVEKGVGRGGKRPASSVPDQDK